MCGIAGFYLPNILSHRENELLMQDMCELLKHRGPDQQDVFFDQNTRISLGHTRLSIHDLSISGQQPMISHCGRYVIVFNGEIYNYQELRSYIDRQKTVSWRGTSDTEVLIELIALEGFDSALKKLNGMFAFAILDKESSCLHIAKDKFGEKPIYIYNDGDSFAFSSEIRPIEKFCNSLTINKNAVATLAKYSYIPAPHSIYNEVFKLQPGQSVCFKIKPDKSIEMQAASFYWTAKKTAINCVNNRNRQQTIDKSIELVEKSLRDSIMDKMDADVPVGAFLSGGIDSTCVVALMRDYSSDKIKTFSIGFDNSDYNEAAHAKEVAKVLGTEHYELYLKPQDVLANIPKIAEIYDEPFADSSQLATFMVSKFAKEHVTVALTGDSGDELFGGYNRHLYANRLENFIRVFPYTLRVKLSRLIRNTPKGRFDTISRLLSSVSMGNINIQRLNDKANKFANVIDAKNGLELYKKLTRTSSEQRMLDEIFLDLSAEMEDIFLEDSFSLAEKMMLQDTVSYMQHDILTKVDRASMANSLETRIPFLDSRVFETAWSLPIEHKIHKGQSKYPLRKIVSKYVPDKLMNRPKAGFGVPIDSWLRIELRDWAESLLTKESIQRSGVFDEKEVQKIWNRHLSGQYNMQYEIWNILMYQQWFDQKK
jgi:asparagine synthase (glutamine-hydrolysing)